ncbi:MAG: YdbH domain-containing protein, partial [Alphaproteobacteria bacterium]
DNLLRQGGSVTAHISADTEIDGKRMRGEIDATLDAGPDKATIMLRANTPDTGVVGGMTLAINDPHGEPKADIQSTLDIASLSRLASIIPALGGLGGALRVRARTMSPMALPRTLPSSAARLTSLLCRGTGASLALDASNLRQGSMIDGLNGAIEARLRCDTVGKATGDIDLKLAAKRVATGAVSATGARLTGPLRIRWWGRDVTLEIPKALKLAFAGITTPAAKTGPLRASISMGKQPAVRLRLNEFRPGAARVDVTARLEPLAITVPGKDAAPPVAIDLAAARLTASGSLAGSLKIGLNAARADIARGDIALGLGGIKARAMRPDSGKPVSFNAAAQLDTALEAKKLLEPLDVTLGGTFGNSTLTFEAMATGPAGLRLSATGRHALTSGAGAADVALARLQFGEGGVELADILPGRRPYAPRAGALEAAAKIAWSDGKFDGSADVTVEDMRIANEDGTVSIDGLATRLRFDRLWPPVTAPKQQLTARRIMAGVALDDMKLRFALRPGTSPTQPAVAIDEMRVGFAGGVVSARDIAYDPARAVNRATVRLDGIDLKALFDVAQVEGLSGTGTISGAIPVRMEGGEIAIDKGALAAAGSGVLHFKSDAAKQALEAGGEYVTLALEALEDFRYRKLAFEIDKALAGNGTVRMQVEGHNPAILDAHPFAINLNVSGDADKLAGLLARLMLLPEEIVRSIVPKER